MGHYYEKTAGGVIPRHFVPMTSRPGESRPTRINDARKHGWVPSVTTIQGMLDKPALNDWRIMEHLKIAHGLHKDWNDAEVSFEEYASEVKALTQSALDKAPKDGTDFHDSMEKHMNGFAVLNEHVTACDMTLLELRKYCDNQKWTTEQSFVHSLGFAGKCDIHSPDWVIDYKTKNTADKFKPGKMAYPEHAMQLAAYRAGLGLHNARCANVFICLQTGEIDFHEHGPETLDMEWANFTDLLRIWIRKAGYVPGKPA